MWPEHMQVKPIVHLTTGLCLVDLLIDGASVLQY